MRQGDPPHPRLFAFYFYSLCRRNSDEDEDLQCFLLPPPVKHWRQKESKRSNPDGFPPSPLKKFSSTNLPFFWRFTQILFETVSYKTGQFVIPPLASMSSSPLPWSAAGSPLHDLGGAAKEKRGKTSQERPTNNSLLAPEEKEGEENCVGIGEKREKKWPRVSIVVSYTVPYTGVRKSFLTLCYTTRRDKIRLERG